MFTYDELDWHFFVVVVDDDDKSKLTYHILIQDLIYTKQIIQTAQKLLIFVTSIPYHSVNDVFALLRCYTVLIG